MVKQKAKYWCAVCYPENMIDNWETEIGDILQLPFCYAIHDKCLDQEGNKRKTHVHIILAFPNTTTQKHAMETFDLLSRSGCKCLSTLEQIINIRHMYNYLIHDTDACKKKNKYVYPASARVSGNNFDIGQYEQLSAKEKDDMAMELGDLIIQEQFVNFTDFYMYVRSNFDSSYSEILKTYSGLFERLTRGNFQKGFKKGL